MLTVEELNLMSSTCSKIYNSSQKEEFWQQVAARHFVGINSESNTPSHSTSEEYFVHDYMEVLNDEHFLDVGAFNGDTILKFFSQEVTGFDERRALGIEPDFQNFLALKNTLKQDNCSVLHTGVGDSLGLAAFSESHIGTDSKVIKGQGTILVPIVTLDKIYEHYKFTYVKMDIEGYEQPALVGSKNVILNQNIKWAISSYHRADDIWMIPRYFDNNYKIQVASHAPRPWDTTFYFEKN